MRYLLIGFCVLCVAVVSVAGLRGSKSQRPPIEIIPDMDRQPKLRPQTVNAFFPDGLSSRLQVPGTVARGEPYADTPVNTGRMTGTTNFVETIPVPVTAELLARGQQRFNVNCAICHGPAGDGKGVVTKLGMTVIADLHDILARKLVQAPDGQIFDTITNGKNLMGGYGANIAVADRWAIVAYVRALQRSHLATLEDVPDTQQGIFKK
ncbi:MAG: c-type cytochrome [Pedosphaera parvula]|nr:c-type cytochrome [Pedosphaera parvula]